MTVNLIYKLPPFQISCWYLFDLYCVVQYADESFSPEPIKGEVQEAKDQAGSFSPELFHGDENEEAIDPEEDRALLVIFKHGF